MSNQTSQDEENINASMPEQSEEIPVEEAAQKPDASLNKASTDSDESQPYKLYTEHIVKKPGAGLKRFAKKAVALLGMAVIFGLIAGLIMIIVYRVGTKMIPDPPTKQAEVETTAETATAEKTTETAMDTTTEPMPQTPEETTPEESAQETHGDVTISIEDVTPEQTQESADETGVTGEETGEVETEETVDPVADIRDEYSVLKNVVNKVNRSMVTVRVSKETMDWMSSTYQNITEEFGLVVANKESGCYVLTEYDLIRNAQDVQVTFSNGESRQANLMAGDATTGLAVIMTEQVSEEVVEIATLANVESLSQGDFVLAVGKLYGFAGSIGYGIATSTMNYVNDTDSVYRLINTNIVGTENSAGVIANLSGEIVGIITTAYNSGNNSLITAYAVAGMTGLIENLSNAYFTPYFGIKGQDVSDSIRDQYELPQGIYVASVETNSPAFKTGLQTGDVITSIEGQEILSMSQFMEVLASFNPDDTVLVKVMRKGRDSYKEIEFTLTLSVE